MQVEDNLATSDIYDNYIRTDSTAIPYDNNFTFHVPSNGNNDVVYFKYPELNGIMKYYMVGNSLYVTIAGHLNPNTEIDYIAASPITRGYSYSGSGLPYPNPEVAYEGTPNIGSITSDAEGDFKVEIEYPNSYYVRQGSILLNPHISFYTKSTGKLYTVDVGRPVQNRSLTGLPDRYKRSSIR